MTSRNIFHAGSIAKAIRSRLAAHLHIVAFGAHGKLRFRGDSRYDLDNVTRGFASHIEELSDDRPILQRICDAYIRADHAQNTLGPEGANAVPNQGLKAVRQALLAGDLSTLAKMYKNFYRDACSSGLLGVPGGNTKAYFSGQIGNKYRHFYLSHVLYRLDYWKTLTEGKYSIQTLAGPGNGNPFGVVIDGTHISVGAEYAHYCSQRVIEQLEPGDATIAQIGGGFGGIAYYLLRDRPGTRYIDVDIPEYVALTSYYLMKAFPHLQFLCYGEKTLTQRSISEADIVLIPQCAQSELPSQCATLTFTSHGLSNQTGAALNRYLDTASHITTRQLFLISNEAIAENLSEIVRARHDDFRLVETRRTGWHSHKISGAGVGGAANRDASTIVEQSYLRKGEPRKKA